MTGSAPIDAARQRRRLAVMLGINITCVLVAAGAAVGFFAYHALALIYVFAAALVVGFGAHVWLMFGLAHGARPRGSA